MSIKKTVNVAIESKDIGFYNFEGLNYFKSPKDFKLGVIKRSVVKNITPAAPNSEGNAYYNEMSAANTINFESFNEEGTGEDCVKWYKFVTNIASAHLNGAKGSYNIKLKQRMISFTSNIYIYNANGVLITSDLSGNNNITALLDYKTTYFVKVQTNTPAQFYVELSYEDVGGEDGDATVEYIKNSLYLTCYELPQIPDNAKIKEAKLKIYQKSSMGNVENSQLSVSLAENPIYPECELIDPKVVYDKISMQNSADGGVVEYSFNVTNFIMASKYTTLDNKALVIRHITEADNITCNATIFGADDTQYAPKIEVTCETGYTGEIGKNHHSNDLGCFGQGKVDLKNGILSFNCEDFAWNGSRMPIAINHLYNGALFDKQFTADTSSEFETADFSKMKLGLGFKLNVMQSIVKNSDGNYIYFTEESDPILLQPTATEGIYKSSEEDGELEFDEIANILKNGDNFLFDESGRLVKITDEKNNTNEFIYFNGKLIKVIDGAKREFVFTYDDNDFLVSIKAPDNTEIEYSYTNDLLTSIVYPNDQKAEITYTDKKVTTVTLFDNETAVYKNVYTYSEKSVTNITEFGFQDGVETQGKTTTFNYDSLALKTVVTTSDTDIETTYFFDDDGEIINQYSSDMVANINNLTNHNFNGLEGWNRTSSTLSSTVVESVLNENNTKFGKHYLHIKTTDENAVANGVYQSSGAFIDGDHTFSVFVKITNGFTGENDGVYLKVKYTEFGTFVGQSEKIKNTNNEYVRLAFSKELSPGGYDFEIVADGEGEFQVCGAVVENNTSPSEYNLIIDGGCYYRNSWNSETCFYDEYIQHDTYASLSFFADTSAMQEAHQEVDVKSAQTTRETFKLSGWAKRNTIIVTESEENSPTFRLRAEFTYTDGKKNEKPITVDFNTRTTEWQYNSVEFSKDAFKEVKNLVIYCDSDYSDNTVWFDNIELIRTSIETDLTEEDFIEEIPDDTQTTTPDDNTQNQGGDQNQGNGDPEPTNEFEELIDDFGNALTETIFTDGEFGTIYRSFGFDEDGNNLLVETDARGNKTEYDVDGNTSRNNEVIDRLGNKTCYEYDASGRTTKVISKNADGDEIANVSYSYDIFDNLTEIARGDGLKYVLEYNAFHNLESIGIDGKSDGNLINYTYKENNGRLKEMTYANGDKMTATYDGKGQMIAEKWYDASGNLTAYYKYAYDSDGNIVRSLDILAGKLYNYMYEEGKITYACESAVTIDNYDFVTSKTPIWISRYFYDKEDTLTKKRVLFADGNEQVISYTTAENESQLVKTQIGENSFVSTSKTDSFGRKEFDELQLGSGFVSRQFDYVSGEVTDEHKSENMLKSTPTTQLVSEITFQDGRTIDYEYDAEERIIKVIDSLDGVTEYTYDSLGQLLTETKNGEVINQMTYDNYGNIKSKNGINYVYNGVWKDRLSHVGGKEISYDAQGNPTEYLGHFLHWEKGRQLKSFDNTTYTYNANGIRTSKTVDKVRHDFHLDGGKILREVWLDNVLETVFDNEDTVCGIVYNGKPFYFMKNLQGDVIAITDKDGEVVAKYNYDAWGKCEVDSSSKNAEIAHINPFRYRSYYYDRETNLYYLQSRYYDAEVGRFINGDEGINFKSPIGLHVFSYCENDPINFYDNCGTTKKPTKKNIYEPKKALEYAAKWWNKRNNDFYSYSKDCANFVSQCLYAGNFAPMTGSGRNSGWHSYKYKKKFLFWNITEWDVSASWSTVKGLINWIILSMNYTRHYISSKKELIKNIKNKNIKSGIPAFVSAHYNGEIDHAILIGRVTKENAYYYGHTNNRNAKSNSYGLIEYFNNAPKKKSGKMVVFYIV